VCSGTDNATITDVVKRVVIVVIVRVASTTPLPVETCVVINVATVTSNTNGAAAIFAVATAITTLDPTTGASTTSITATSTTPATATAVTAAIAAAVGVD
jgi:hypothetical protein